MKQTSGQGQTWRRASNLGPETGSKPIVVRSEDPELLQDAPAIRRRWRQHRILSGVQLAPACVPRCLQLLCIRWRPKVGIVARLPLEGADHVGQEGLNNRLSGRPSNPLSRHMVRNPMHPSPEPRLANVVSKPPEFCCDPTRLRQERLGVLGGREVRKEVLIRDAERVRGEEVLQHVCGGRTVGAVPRRPSRMPWTNRTVGVMGLRSRRSSRAQTGIVGSFVMPFCVDEGVKVHREQPVVPDGILLRSQQPTEVRMAPLVVPGCT